MKTKSALSTKIFLFLAIVYTGTGVMAQDTIPKPSTTSENSWNFLLEPYFMFPNMKGTSGVGILPEVEVDANPGDIFDKLSFGAMLYFEAGNDHWAFSSDIVYMNLKQDLKTGVVIQSGEAEAKQFIWELAAMHKLFSRLEGGIGIRLNSMDMGIHLVRNTIGGGTEAGSNSASEMWVDPFIVARIKSDPARKFIYQLRGDIGGFGIGSDLAWQIQAYAGYRFSKLFQMTVGYRYIGMDYDKGSDENRFLYDIDTFGPVVRVGFNF
jgi:hypothetical protein